MEQTQLFKDVQKVASHTLKVPMERIQPETKLREDLEADSLFLMQFLLALEDEFEMQTDDNDMEHIFTIADTVRYVEACLELK